MTILHHATVSKASKIGIDLVRNEIEGKHPVKATLTDFPTREIYGTDGKSTMLAAQASLWLAPEYPDVDILFLGDQYVVTHKGMMVENSAFTLDGLDNDLDEITAYILEAVQDAGLSPSEDEDDSNTASTIVHHSYRQAYRERGNAAHCSDWLASTLEGEFQNEEGLFDHKLFEACLLQNGVELTGKWADLPTSGQKGWQGRYRMNGRQKLELEVADAGTLKLRELTITPDPEWLKEMRTKHHKTLDKRAALRDPEVTVPAESEAA